MKPAPPVTRTFINHAPLATRRRTLGSTWRSDERMAIAEDDSHDGVAHPLGQILGRHDPVSWSLDAGADTRRHALRVSAAQYVAAAFQGFGSFRGIPNRDRRNPHDAAFFLHGSAVRQYTECPFLERHEIEEAQRR